MVSQGTNYPVSADKNERYYFEPGKHLNPISEALDYKNYSEVVGSIIEVTRFTEFAGKPPCLACSRTISSLGAM